MFGKIVALATAGLLSSAAHAATTVTFTEAGVTNGTAVTTQYQSFGITADNLRHYVDGRDTFDANGVTPDSLPATITFTDVAGAISFDYVLLAGSSLTVSLFDSANQLLESVSIPTANGNVNASYSFAANGAKTFSMSNAAGTFGLSTLRFDSAGAVPEPATWAMLILGFGAIGGASRRRSALQMA